MKSNQTKYLTITTSVLGSYGLLKIPSSKIDPYVRTAIVGVSGFGLLFYPNVYVKSIGIGMMISAVANAIETINYDGGKMIKNSYNNFVYFIGEDTGVETLNPFEIPKIRIDGITINGYNGVFKVSNGVYIKVLSDGTIIETSELGKVANIIKGGFKTKSWCEKQGDKRWIKLYEKSI